jgi:hypothetical protein
MLVTSGACDTSKTQASDVIGVGLAGRLARRCEVLVKNRDEAIMLAEPVLECGVRGDQAVMVKLQLCMCIWVRDGGHQLSAEVQVLDG